MQRRNCDRIFILSLASVPLVGFILEQDVLAKV